MRVDEDGDSESSDDSYFEVDRILAKRVVGKKRVQYLVKWQGYTEAEATWEPPSNLQNVKNLIKEWELKEALPEGGLLSSSEQTNDRTQVLNNGAKQKTLSLGSKAIKKADKIQQMKGGLRRGRYSTNTLAKGHTDFESLHEESQDVEMLEPENAEVVSQACKS